jgi:hypothetical protein
MSTKRIETISKIVTFGTKVDFVRLIDFPVYNKDKETPDSWMIKVIQWAMAITTQTDHTIELLKTVEFTLAQIEDQNLLNYLELMMGKELTPLPRPKIAINHKEETIEGKKNE